jgi:ribonuclease E
MRVLRAIEEEGIRMRTSEVTVKVPMVVALYILNQKRPTLVGLEARYGFQVFLEGDNSVIPPDINIERVKGRPEPAAGQAPRREVDADTGIVDLEATKDELVEGSGEGTTEKLKRRRRRGRRRTNNLDTQDDVKVSDDAASPENGSDISIPAGGDLEGGKDVEAATNIDGEEKPRRRRRGRRGGRRRNRNNDEVGVEPSTEGAVAIDDGSRESSSPDAKNDGENPAKDGLLEADANSANIDSTDTADKASTNGDSVSPSATPIEVTDRAADDNTVNENEPDTKTKDIGGTDAPRRKGWWQKIVE